VILARASAGRRASRRLVALLAASSLVVTLAAGQVASAEDGMPSRVPDRLSQTGLLAADGSIDARNRVFVPQYPLWTDGAAKRRWVRLPEGATIDVSDLDAWRFPTGTTFWKEFAWAGRRIETRMIRLERDGTWTFAAYVWSDDQRDALLAPAEGMPRAFELPSGKRHSIPSVADCQSCHGSAPATVLGFSALQLSDDRDPLAPHAEALPANALTLRGLIAAGLLSPARPELAAAPPRIRAADPVARAALGYLSANCGGCHNERGPLARLEFSLLHEVSAGRGKPEPGHVTTEDARGRYVMPGVEPEASRIVTAGVPERSTLLYRMRSRRPSSQMPPLGSVEADPEGVALVQRWIESLGPNSDSAPKFTQNR
jgi:mono/diheme cytochrome c family protein